AGGSQKQWLPTLAEPTFESRAVYTQMKADVRRRRKPTFGFMCVSLILAIFPMQAVEPIVILGGGVGSLTSALYLGRAGYQPLVIEGPTPGGLLTQSSSVQNWPGELEVTGSELVDKMHAQAEANGARFLQEEVVDVDFSKRPFTIVTRSLDGSEQKHQILAESCIIAMGTKPNYLGIPGEQKYWGRGVTNCAICDGALYKDKVVGVVGGGDAAILEALYLANIAKEVHVFIRKDALKAMEEKRIQTLKKKPNVKFHFNTIVQEVKGDANGVTSVTLKSGSHVKPFALDGLFLAIGSTPNTKVFKNALALDKQGYIALKKDQETSVQGVYAIGDIVDPIYKQAISASGDGAKAAMQAQQYLSDRTNLLIVKNEATVVQAPKGSVVEMATVEQFREVISSSDMPVVADFYASWCGPCKQAAPILDRYAAQLTGKVKFIKVNVDQLPKLSSEYNIRAMPTVILFDGGKETSRKVGVNQIQDLLNGLSAAR
ncbi:MAG: thioredoxin, partial [Verrucomicrobia bacterium]|nr:thioredoxin [Verrucomicrobiota bacterium]